MRDASPVLAGAVAVVGALAGRVEGFPGDAGGIVDPGFFRLGVTAVRLAFLEHIAARLTQPGVDVVQFLGVLDLNAEMVETRLPSPWKSRNSRAGLQASTSRSRV